jgi:hypothetical protein
MQGIDGQRRMLAEYTNKKAIIAVFVGSECQLANLSCIGAGNAYSHIELQPRG